MSIQRTPWCQGANGALAFMRAGSRKAVMLLMGLLALLGAPAHAEKHIYYVTDAQGTVVATMDSQARVTYTAAYRPYGEQAEGAPQAGPGYTGHVNDPATGLVYMQQRYYDPSVGRFLSPDPVAPAPGNVFNLGRYTYANNNPLRFTDPDGKQSVGEMIDSAAQGCGAVSCAGFALLHAAWVMTGAEPVSQVADKGWSNVSTADKIGAVTAVASVIPVGRVASAVGKVAEGAEVASDAARAGKILAKDGEKASDLGTVFVDSKGNAIPTPKGGSITGSPDGRYIQVRDAEGNLTGARIDGPHKPATHPDPRAQRPHAHVPGVKNPDGTPWLPINY